MKSIGGRLRGWEKAKLSNLWDWIIRQIDTYSFYIGGYRTVSNEQLQQAEMVDGEKDDTRGSVVSCSGGLCPEGSGKGD